MPIVIHQSTTRVDPKQFDQGHQGTTFPGAPLWTAQIQVDTIGTSTPGAVLKHGNKWKKNNNWLVVSTPLKNMSSPVGMIIPNIYIYVYIYIHGKIKHVPNHQPDLRNPQLHPQSPKILMVFLTPQNATECYRYLHHKPYSYCSPLNQLM